MSKAKNKMGGPARPLPNGSDRKMYEAMKGPAGLRGVGGAAPKAISNAGKMKKK